MSTMHAWQFNTTAGGIEHNLYLPAAGVPKPQIRDNQILVEVYSAALNPADHKVPELGLIARAMVPSPSIPGVDFCGKVCATGQKTTAFHVGQMVFGIYWGPFGQGSLAQYVAVTEKMIAAVPTGLRVDDMAGVGVAGLTAYDSVQPYVKASDKVLINGGSGGTGIFSIQIAKALGCHVIATCSAASSELCKSLGADETIDYQTVDLVEELKKKGPVFSLVVDNVGSPANLYSESHHFVVEQGHYVQVGSGSGLSSAIQLLGNMMRPSFLGGGKRKFRFLLMGPDQGKLAKLGNWIDEGKIKLVTDSVWDWEDVPKAFEKLKTQRAKGKIVVHVKHDILNG